jgi:hypothetical protein
MLDEILLLVNTIQPLRFEDEGGDGGDGGDGGGGDGGDGDGNKDTGKTFTQEQVNAIMKKEKETYQKQKKTLMQQLEDIKANKNLSDQEKTDLETQIEDLRKQTMTTEELAKEDKTKTLKAHKKEVDKITEESNLWKQRYTTSTIERSIVDASIESKAFHPEQIVALLTPKTRLVEELDESGKSTGQLIPKVEFETVDEDDKPVKLDLSPAEAVKKMTEEDKYANLFKSDRTSGFGVHTTSSSKKSNKPETVSDIIARRREQKKKGTS